VVLVGVTAPPRTLVGQASPYWGITQSGSSAFAGRERLPRPSWITWSAWVELDGAPVSEPRLLVFDPARLVEQIETMR
jgi:hypothetical protein